MQHKHTAGQAKDFAGELFDPQYLNVRAASAPQADGESDGLESTQDC
jgi:hypothetical protein